MRNLKRALSLALASLMLVGMMVVGTSAASFPDVTSAENVEAIEVLKAVGVMEGDTDGKFNPAANVTRNEMAVVMCNLLGLKPDDFKGACVFTDVPDWAKTYVAACHANSIVSGTSATTYDGEGSVTAAQAGLMVMKALGYFQYNPDFGEDWQLATIKKAADISLFDNISANADAALTRNDVAQLVLTGLKSDVVTASGSQGTEIVTSDGTKIAIGYDVKYNAVLDAANTYDYSVGTEGNGTKQLAEKLYKNDLKLNSGDEDGMGRTAKTWTYKADDVGTYAKSAGTTKVIAKEKTVADIIKDINKTYTTTATTVYVNGAAKTLAYSVKVGSVVELFMNSSNAKAVDKVCVTEYSVDEATGAAVTKGSAADDDLQIRIPGFIGYTDAGKVNGNYAELAKGDRVYYYEDADGVYTFAKAGSFEGKMTGSTSTTPVKYVIDGTNYIANGNTAITGVTTSPAYNTAYTYYTDANGYLIAAEKVESEQSNDYVVMQAIAFAGGTGGISGSQKVEARLVKMDGSVEVVEIETVKLGATPTVYTGIKTDGADGNKLASGASLAATKVTSAISAKAGKAFFTYSKNSDNEYTLTEVVANTTDKITVGVLAADNDIKSGNAVIAGTGAPAMNNSTLFIVANKSEGKEFTAYTGKDNVPDVTDPSVGAYIAKNGIATYVYADKYASATISGDEVYFMKATKDEFRVEKDANDDTIYYNIYKAIVDGEATTVKVKAGSNGDNDITGALAIGLFTPTYKDGLITALVTKDADVAKANGYTLSDGTLRTGTMADTNAGSYTYSGDELIFVMDTDGDVTSGTIADLDEDDNNDVYVIKTASDKAVVDYLFIVENDDDVVTLDTLALDDGSNDLTIANAVKDGNTYTFTRTATDNQTDGGVSATAKGVGTKVEYSTDNSTFGDSPLTSLNFAKQSTADSTLTVYVRLTSVDDSTVTYTIKVVTPGTGA